MKSRQKRFGKPRAKKGELKLKYGKIDGQNDHVIAWGDGIPPCDRALLYHLVNSKSYSPVRNVWDDSFIEELEKRGYDLTTLQISIQKKKTEKMEGGN